MISGALRSILLLFPLAALAQSWDLQALMAAMAQVPSSQTRFVETRHLAMLMQPIELKGSLRYERPNRLTKQIESPFNEQLSIDGEAVTLVNRKGEKRVVSLREQPALGALVESVRATLAGDRAKLERHYKVAFSGPRESWTLRLAPREAKVRAYVDTITLTGAGARVEGIEVLEAGGDRSVMRIQHDAR
jgi:outer membrane lipoprotein-sorting protein